MNFQLRNATNADREAIENLVFSALREHGLKPDPAATDADLRDLEQTYFARGGSFDVLVNEAREIVGTIGLYRNSDSECELRKMYLAPSARGFGQGKRLLEHALGRARELGFQRVVLETAFVLRRAIELYESFGFKPYTPEHMSPRCERAYFLDLDRK
jgi:putative acetyltransferase